MPLQFLDSLAPVGPPLGLAPAFNEGPDGSVMAPLSESGLRSHGIPLPLLEQGMPSVI